MFPLTEPTLFQLAFIGVAVSGALAVQFGWQRCRFLILLAAVPPSAVVLSDPPSGQLAELVYFFAVVWFVVALAIGATIGGALRFAGIGRLRSVGAIVVIAAGAAAFHLHQQFIPSACLGSPFQVEIAGETLGIPPEMTPRLKAGDDIYRFGRMDRKLEYAQFCRMSQNGTRSVDVDTVWLTPASNHRTMSVACNADDAPTWCSTYDPEPYRYTLMIRIEPDAEPGVHLLHWTEGGLPERHREGDVIEGSVCLLSENGFAAQCYAWQPFGDRARLTVTSHHFGGALGQNHGPSFEELTSDEVQEIMRQARDVALSIIDPSQTP